MPRRERKRPQLNTPLWALVLIIPACFFGASAPVAMGFLCILLHEGAHALTARLFGIREVSITLLPFGGVARLGEAPSMLAQCTIALAGPLFNFALAQLGLIAFRFMREAWLALFIKTNLALGLFNLVPTYPLDGGRLLCAVLGPLCGRERAMRISCLLGMALGLFFLCLAGYVFWVLKVINLSFVMMGGLLFVVAHKGYQQGLFERLKQSEAKRRQLLVRPLRVQMVAMGAQRPAMEAVRLFRHGRLTTIIVKDEHLKTLGTVEEGELLNALIQRGSAISLEKTLDRRSTHHIN